MHGEQRGNQPAGRNLTGRGAAGRRWPAWAVLTGAVLAAAAVSGPGSPARAAGSPPAPSAGAVRAAAGQVSAHAAALNAARVQLAAANARLASLRNQAEVTIERYDKAMVSLRQARVAYRAAEAKLGRARLAEAASHRRVAALATQEYEAGGGFGSMATMLGNNGGPQAYFQGADAEQQLARQGDDVLALNQATRVVADVFRAQARRELSAEQAAARQAAALKAAIEAAVAHQQAAVRAIAASTKRLETELGAAQAHEFQLAQARQRALAAQQARAQALAAQQAAASNPVTTAPSGGGGYSYGTWPSSFSLGQGASAAQGNIAANWALSQMGKPYQWGGAGPYTYDCSGLSMDAWAHAGVTLQHWTGFQWPSGPHIPLSELRRGDLLFFATNTSDPNTIHHVGIYIGNGEMVDAPYTGVDVRIDSIYQPGGLIGATRPAG